MKFIARVLVEKRYEIQAADITDAVRQIQAVQRGLSSNSKLLGIVQEGVSWDEEKPTPPVGTPPAGSPGTPTIAIDQPVTEARAA